LKARAGNAGRQRRGAASGSSARSSAFNHEPSPAVPWLVPRPVPQFRGQFRSQFRKFRLLLAALLAMLPAALLAGYWPRQVLCWQA